MNTPQPNPFNLTTANDYSDTEIKDYWVDLPMGHGYLGLIKPTSPMPMILLGGKGSGKTHLMRYCAYEIQKLRWKDPPLEELMGDGYMGIYMRCEGLNANRFAGKGQKQEIWDAVFQYYMELFLAELLLTHVGDFSKLCPEVAANEKALWEAILDLFDRRDTNLAITIPQLVARFKSLRREIDGQVNNCPITKRLEVDILVTRSRLVFGIPEALSRLKPLRKVRVLYLIDELENFSESQQEYVFTLVRERRGPSSFRIGSRLYGIKTFSTLSGDEEIKEGSEYEKLLLDERFRSNEREYHEFSKRLIASRILRAPLGVRPSDSLDRMMRALPSMFEDRDEHHFYSAETATIAKKYEGREPPWLSKLRAKLLFGLRAGYLVGVRSEHHITEILTRLRAPELPLLEKTNILLLFRDWSNNSDLREPDSAGA